MEQWYIKRSHEKKKGIKKLIINRKIITFLFQQFRQLGRSF